MKNTIIQAFVTLSQNSFALQTSAQDADSIARKLVDYCVENKQPDYEVVEKTMYLFPKIEDKELKVILYNTVFLHYFKSEECRSLNFCTSKNTLMILCKDNHQLFIALLKKQLGQATDIEHLIQHSELSLILKLLLRSSLELNSNIYILICRAILNNETDFELIEALIERADDPSIIITLDLIRFALKNLDNKSFLMLLCIACNSDSKQIITDLLTESDLKYVIANCKTNLDMPFLREYSILFLKIIAENNAEMSKRFQNL